jgi:hypothetical protein
MICIREVPASNFARDTDGLEVFRGLTQSQTANSRPILWHVDPFLGHGRETNKTMAITRQRPVNIRETVFLSSPCRDITSRTFSEKSVSQSVEWSELVGWWVRGLLQFGRCELLLSEAGSWGTGAVREPRGSGTTAVGKPLPEDWWRHSRLRRL